MQKQSVRFILVLLAAAFLDLPTGKKCSRHVGRIFVCQRKCNARVECLTIAITLSERQHRLVALTGDEPAELVDGC